MDFKKGRFVLTVISIILCIGFASDNAANPQNNPVQLGLQDKARQPQQPKYPLSWSKTYNSFNGEVPAGISRLSNSSFVIASTFKGSFLPGSSQAALTEIDTNGSVLRSVGIDNITVDRFQVFSVTGTTSGEVVCAGECHIGGFPGGVRFGLVFKLDNNFALSWATTVTTPNTVFNSVTQLSTGNIAVGGRSANNASLGVIDNATGTFLWCNSYSTTNASQWISSLAETSDKQIFAVGTQIRNPSNAVLCIKANTANGNSILELAYSVPNYSLQAQSIVNSPYFGVLICGSVNNGNNNFGGFVMHIDSTNGKIPSLPYYCNVFLSKSSANMRFSSITINTTYPINQIVVGSEGSFGNSSLVAFEIDIIGNIKWGFDYGPSSSTNIDASVVTDNSASAMIKILGSSNFIAQPGSPWLLSLEQGGNILF
ncbi:MAG: hypothetical protein HY606_08725, partial [Planctomycetes bacterium]|nr:hypothetical protein [Planctomycetota bacterium]